MSTRTPRVSGSALEGGAWLGRRALGCRPASHSAAHGVPRRRRRSLARRRAHPNQHDAHRHGCVVEQLDRGDSGTFSIRWRTGVSATSLSSRSLSLARGRIDRTGSRASVFSTTGSSISSAGSSRRDTVLRTSFAAARIAPEIGLDLDLGRRLARRRDRRTPSIPLSWRSGAPSRRSRRWRDRAPANRGHHRSGYRPAASHARQPRRARRAAIGADDHREDGPLHEMSVNVTASARLRARGLPVPHRDRRTEFSRASPSMITRSPTASRARPPSVLVRSPVVIGRAADDFPDSRRRTRGAHPNGRSLGSAGRRHRRAGDDPRGAIRPGHSRIRGSSVATRTSTVPLSSRRVPRTPQFRETSPGSASAVTSAACASRGAEPTRRATSTTGRNGIDPA